MNSNWLEHSSRTPICASKGTSTRSLITELSLTNRTPLIRRDQELITNRTPLIHRKHEVVINRTSTEAVEMSASWPADRGTNRLLENRSLAHDNSPPDQQRCLSVVLSSPNTNRKINPKRICHSADVLEKIPTTSGMEGRQIMISHLTSCPKLRGQLRARPEGWHDARCSPRPMHPSQPTCCPGPFRRTACCWGA